MNQLSRDLKDSILASVDFDCIHNYMTEMGLTWKDGSPPVAILKEILDEMLTTYHHYPDSIVSFGGFFIKYKDGEVNVCFADTINSDAPVVEYQFKFD